MEEIFDSAVRTRGDLAGVFEYDGETGYFYLYEVGRSGNKIVDAIPIVAGPVDFGESDVSVRWDAAEQKVGMFIRQSLWAVFDTSSKTKHGGHYTQGGVSLVTDLKGFLEV